MKCMTMDAKVVWELDVVGDEEKFDTNDEIQLAINQTLEEYLAEAQEVIDQSHCRSHHHRGPLKSNLPLNKPLKISLRRPRRSAC